MIDPTIISVPADLEARCHAVKAQLDRGEILTIEMLAECAQSAPRSNGRCYRHRVVLSFGESVTLNPSPALRKKH